MIRVVLFFDGMSSSNRFLAVPMDLGHPRYFPLFLGFFRILRILRLDLFGPSVAVARQLMLPFLTFVLLSLLSFDLLTHTHSTHSLSALLRIPFPVLLWLDFI